MRSKRRLFLDIPLEIGLQVPLSIEGFQHLIKVLRLAEGDEVVLFNGRGGEFVGRLAQVERRHASVQVQAFRARERESNLALELAQACSRSDRMDLTLQKATELGVACVTPLMTQRTQGRIPQLERKREHWRGVVISACEQCGRNRLPAIADPRPFMSWLSDQRHEPGSRLLMDPEAEQSLGEFPAPTGRVVVVVGPEGGFDHSEREAAREAGIVPVRLGPRVLRTETAGLVALAVIQALWGDLN